MPFGNDPYAGDSDLPSAGPFENRRQAGRLLARAVGSAHVMPSAPSEEAVVLALPRGGVPVAAEVAWAFGAPLDVVLVRKLGVPSQPELAMGAIGEDGVRVVDEAVLRRHRISDALLAEVEARARADLEGQARLFRGDRARLSPRDKVAVVVDDGIATGSSARAACKVVRAQGARMMVLAVPVAPPRAEIDLSDVADHLICVATPRSLVAVGQWYADFSQTADDEVVALLRQAEPG